LTALHEDNDNKQEPSNIQIYGFNRVYELEKNSNNCFIL
jgi:hypothetical protein